MKKVMLFVPLIAAACATTMDFGGAGQTTKGLPVSGLMSFNEATKIFNIELDSPTGWSCAATFQHSGKNMQKRSVPLTCNDGRKGTLILTSNAIQGQVVGTFSLTGGEAGQVSFGRT